MACQRCAVEFRSTEWLAFRQIGLGIVAMHYPMWSAALRKDLGVHCKTIARFQEFEPSDDSSSNNLQTAFMGNFAEFSKRGWNCGAVFVCRTNVTKWVG